MPSSPSLVLVDPRAQHRAAVRQHLLAVGAGMVLAALSAVPLVLTLAH